MIMFKVTFSLFSNINRSACSTLDWVLNSHSDFDWVLYKHHLEIQINKKIIPILTCPIGEILSWYCECKMCVFRALNTATKEAAPVDSSQSAQYANQSHTVNRACQRSKLPSHHFTVSTNQLAVLFSECWTANQILTGCYVSIIWKFK